jgi:hypothetical protein
MKSMKQRVTPTTIAASVVRFLGAGGVKASLVKGGQVQVGDRRFGVPSAVAVDAPARSRWFNGLVMEVAGDRLATNAERQLGGALVGPVTLRPEARVLLVE